MIKDWRDIPVMQARSFTMKDGREAVIRPVVPDDAAGMLAMEVRLHVDDVGVVQTVEEIDQTVPEMRESLERLQPHNPGGCHFAALVDDVIVGSSSVRRPKILRLRHIGRFAVGLDPAHRALGLGRALMERAIEWALDGPGCRSGGIRRLELNVFADNTPAIALYESLGFEVEGCRRDFLRRDDGTFVDDLCMVRLEEQRDPAP